MDTCKDFAETAGSECGSTRLLSVSQVEIEDCQFDTVVDIQKNVTAKLNTIP